ncbi:MAG: hypothetical protein ACP6IS_03040 [Candidatus Asgardarchaeia archaeon]
MDYRELEIKIIDVLNSIYPEYTEEVPKLPELIIKLLSYMKKNMQSLVKITGKTEYIESKLLQKLKKEIPEAEMVYIKLLDSSEVSFDEYLKLVIDSFLVFLRSVFKDKYDPERLSHLVYENKYLLPSLIVAAFLAQGY